VTAIRVVGVGSPFGDDRAGWLVAERLAPALGAHGARVEVCALDRPGPALLHAVAGCEVAIVIDAVSGTAEAGTIHRLDVSAFAADAPTGAASAHAFGLAESLRLGAALNLLPPRLLVYGIEVGPVGLGEALSPEVVAAADRLASEIMAVIESELAPE